MNKAQRNLVIIWALLLFGLLTLLWHGDWVVEHWSIINIPFAIVLIIAFQIDEYYKQKRVNKYEGLIKNSPWLLIWFFICALCSIAFLFYALITGITPGDFIGFSELVSIFIFMSLPVIIISQIMNYKMARNKPNK